MYSNLQYQPHTESKISIVCHEYCKSSNLGNTYFYPKISRLVGDADLGLLFKLSWEYNALSYHIKNRMYLRQC